MTDANELNPAELAAKNAMDAVLDCIDKPQSFILEAGAGSGKTHTLVGALKHLIDRNGRSLQRQSQQIACITYTNVAKDEIRSRTDRHPVIFADTIHSFSWSLLRNFQSEIHRQLPALSKKWQERIENAGGIDGRPIKYELGFPRVRDHDVVLGHTDVIQLMARLLAKPKFRLVLKARFPVVFIDEYQDIEKSLGVALTEHVIGASDAPLIGLFGDHWQRIYNTTYGKIEHPSLRVIKQGANFRSERRIVEALNRIRTELPQDVRDPSSGGSVEVWHTNNWVGERRSDGAWKGDLPAEEGRTYLKALRERLTEKGWDFSAPNTKVLMLTHNVLADEQGYSGIDAVFRNTEAYTDKTDAHMAFFIDVVEPICEAYEARRFGETFALASDRGLIRSQNDKRKWSDEMEGLLKLRSSGSIGDVTAYLTSTEKLRLPDRVAKKEERFQALRDRTLDDDEQKEFARLEYLAKLHEVPYAEVSVLADFLENATPFSTQHGVKGAEFDNVLVVLGRSWSNYNFNEMLEWATDVPDSKRDAFQRNRNLFYVACSRARKNLVLLFTQEVSAEALPALRDWFGEENIHAC